MKIYQALPNYWYGDAIGNHTALIEELLRGWGHETAVFADVVHEKRSARPYVELADLPADAWVIYHYSTGSPVNRFVLDNASRLILLYHNITPAFWFAPYDPAAAESCEAGRALLPAFAEKCAAAIAVSAYNADELRGLGFTNVHVSPFILDIEKKPATGMNPFGDNKKNFLFVGRVAPHKGHHDLIKTFYFYKTHVERNARLVFVGGYDGGGLYYRALRELIAALGLKDVVFTGPVSDEALGDYFTSAAAFVSLSRHEGFGVPPLEAMSFGTPVVALGEAATPEIVADGGIVVDRFDPATLAELLYDVAHDDALRAKLIEAGYRRLAHLSAEKATARFKEVVEAITA